MENIWNKTRAISINCMCVFLLPISIYVVRAFEKTMHGMHICAVLMPTCIFVSSIKYIICLCASFALDYYIYVSITYVFS